MTTVALQRQATKRLRISGEEVMRIAEGLYNRGLLSYPRTETDSFPDGFDFRSLITGQAESGAPWSAYAQGLLADRFVPPKKGKNNDHAHSPIHPTRAAPDLVGHERSLYELVTRHFLACCSADAKGAETVVEMDLNGERFTCKGLTILEKNYLDVYVYEKWTDKDIPSFREGEQFTPDAVEMKQGTTTPPNLLTEPDLIKLMDQNGIGTDATIAQHIQTIQDRCYAQKQGIYFSPTNLGTALLEAYIAIGHDLGKPAGRAATEADMKLIERGAKTREEVVRDTLAQYRAILDTAMANSDTMEQVLRQFFQPAGLDEARGRDFSHCGKCNGVMSFQEASRVLVCANCNESHTLPRLGQVSTHDHRCPLCNFQVVTITNTEKNTTYNVCPWCYSNPPQKVDRAGFPCFLCTATCPLAKGGGERAITTCPMCVGGELRLVKAKSGTMFIGCKTYPNCKATLWLPTCTAVSTSEDRCPMCNQVYLIVITNASGHLQSRCIRGCDPLFQQQLDAANMPKNLNNFWAGTLQPNSSTSSATSATSQSSRFPSASPAMPKSSGTPRSSAFPAVKSSSGSNSTPLPRPPNSSYRSPPPPAPSPAPPRSFAKPAAAAKPTAASPDGARMCNCGKLAIIRTTVKPGPNHGRQYYKCETGECQFFQFLDEDPVSGGSGAGGDGGGYGGGGTGTKRSWGGDDSMSPGAGGSTKRPYSGVSAGGSTSSFIQNATCFKCQQKGHLASSCPNSGSAAGGYGNAGAGRGRGQSWGRGGSSDAGGGGGACFKCSQPGHFANACPNGGGGGGGGGWRGDGGSGRGRGLGAKRRGRGAASPRTPTTRKCGECGMQGHTKRSCPTLKGGGGGGDVAYDENGGDDGGFEDVGDFE